jgi:hypothetical protein
MDCKANTAAKWYENRTTAPSAIRSCIGRKLVMNQRVEEEIEHVREVIGLQVPLQDFIHTRMAPLNGRLPVNCTIKR